MWHLSPEELARLVDEPANDAETEHLAGCDACAAELRALREQVDELAALPRILPAPTSWPQMRRRLASEGLLEPARPAMRPWMQAAAALVLFVTGGALGLAAGESAAAPTVEQALPASAGSADRPVMGADQGPGRFTTTRVDSGPSAPAGEADPEPEPAADPAAEDPMPPGTRFAAAGEAPAERPVGLRAEQVRTPEEAARLVRQTEDAYVAAMTRFAELTGPRDGDLALRIATLEGIVMTTGAALEEAPADPVINGYHLAARAQRDAMLRTVSNTTPTEEPWF